MVELQKLPSGRVIETPVLKRVVFYEGLPIDKEKELFDEIVAKAREHGGIERVTPFLRFDEKKGLLGSNLGVKILASEVLGEDLRFPTVPGMLALDNLGVLTNQFLVDSGAVFYSPQGPNADKVEQIAEKIKDLKTPVILHPSDLKLGSDGQTYELRKNPRFIISGEEAREYLSKMVHADSGFRRLLRRRGGRWYADWYGLFFSNGYFRVADKVRGEAVARDLQVYEAQKLREGYGDRKRELEAQLAGLSQEEARAVQELGSIFSKK